MKIFRAQFDRNAYPVYIGRGSLKNLKTVLRKYSDVGNFFVVSNKNIFSLYGKSVISELPPDKPVYTIILPDGERYKNSNTLNRLYENMLRSKADRKSLLIALGGGVVGDIAGYAAATYMRGIRYVQIPTSLLSMVDSSIGGKTGIDHPRCKNLIGRFYTPECVMLDPDFLQTLPEREMICGIAEVLKYGIALDEKFYRWLHLHHNELRNYNPNALSFTLLRCCRLKNNIVTKDPYDLRERKILNFGHTFAHAMESASDYKSIKHGEAVMIGMMMAVELSVMVNNLNSKKASEILEFLLPFAKKIVKRKEIAGFIKNTDPVILLNRMTLDKKTASGKNEFILLQNIGKSVIVKNIDSETVYRSIGNVLSLLRK